MARFKQLFWKALDSAAFPAAVIMNRVAMRQAKDIRLGRHKRALASTVDFVEQHMQKAGAFGSKFDLLSAALAQANLSGEKLICEFGVFRGGTINHIATRTSKTVYGFDSFEGLPESWDQGLEKGHFSVKQLPKVRPNVTLIKGWFDQTIPPFLKQNAGTAALLHIDCDLYSSTKIVFDLMEPRIAPGTVIVFDEYFNFPDWQNGEHKAFTEYLERTGLTCRYIGYHVKGQQVAAVLESRK